MVVDDILEQTKKKKITKYINTYKDIESINKKWHNN